MKKGNELQEVIEARKKGQEAREELLKEAIKGRRIDLLKNNIQEIEALSQSTGLSIEKIKEYLEQQEKQESITLK